MWLQTSILTKSGVKVVGHPEHKNLLEEMGLCVLTLANNQKESLSFLTVQERLDDKTEKVPCEMLSGVDGIQEALKHTKKL